MSSDDSPTSEKTSVNLPQNIAAFFAAFFPPLSGIFFLVMEKKNQLVRFHAMQSVVFGIFVAIGYFAITLGVPRLRDDQQAIFMPVAALFLIIWISVWIINVIAAFCGKEWEIPLVGRFARKQLQKKAR